MPPSPLEWLPQEHLAYFILEIVQTLELSDIERVIQSKDPRGQRPYSPHMMVALLLYAYCVGIFSSRKIAQATYDHVAFRVLAGDAHPHFTTVNQFRLDHHEALADRFLQVLHLCQKAGLVKLAHVSLDGSKVQANASKHKAMSYERMQKEEARLKAEIETMLARADGIDREEDKRYGKGQDAAALPEELRRRETRLECIREPRLRSRRRLRRHVPPICASRRIGSATKPRTTRLTRSSGSEQRRGQTKPRTKRVNSTTTMTMRRRPTAATQTTICLATASERNQMARRCQRRSGTSPIRLAGS